MARTLPHSKVNAQKIDADDAYNKIQDRKEGMEFDALESQAGEPTSKAIPQRLTQDPASRPRKP